MVEVHSLGWGSAPQNIFSESDSGGRSSILSVGCGGAGGGPEPSPASSASCAAASSSSASLLSAWEGPPAVIKVEGGEGSLLICTGVGRAQGQLLQKPASGKPAAGWREVGLGTLRMAPNIPAVAAHLARGPGWRCAEGRRGPARVHRLKGRAAECSAESGRCLQTVELSTQH